MLIVIQREWNLSSFDTIDVSRHLKRVETHVSVYTYHQHARAARRLTNIVDGVDIRISNSRGMRELRKRATVGAIVRTEEACTCSGIRMLQVCFLKTTAHNMLVFPHCEAFLEREDARYRSRKNTIRVMKLVYHRESRQLSI